MKKSLIIVLLVIAVVSVFALGILIPKIEQTIVTVKVEGVEFSNSEIVILKDDDNKPYKDDNGNDKKRIPCFRKGAGDSHLVVRKVSFSWGCYP